MSAGLKLTTGAMLIGGAIGYLAFLGGAGSWHYYLSVDEAVADATRITGMRVRVSGRVGAGSLVIGKDRRNATFTLHGQSRVLEAICRCAMPDNLAENVDVVVEGALQEDGLHGHKVITRCASKYQRAGVATAFETSPSNATARRINTAHCTLSRR